MAANEVVVSLAEMIDLAIGTPEIGVVDFIMLQTVLHCLAQQLRCSDKNVALKGALASLPVGRQPDTADTIGVCEYLVQVDGKVPESSEDQDTILLVERVRKSDRPPVPKNKPSPVAPGSEGLTAGAAGATSVAAQAGTPGATSVVSQAEGSGATHGAASAGGPGATSSTVSAGSYAAGPTAPIMSSNERLSLVTLSKFNLLQNTVEDLKKRIYGSIPENEQILEEVRSQTNLKAITDMWTSLNVSSRLEAAEQGLGKLSSLVQDLIMQSSAPPVEPKPAVPESHVGPQTPTSKDLQTGSQSELKAATDLLSARLKTAEQGIENLNGVVQNLIAHTNGLVSESQLRTILSKMYETLPPDALAQLMLSTDQQMADGQVQPPFDPVQSMIAAARTTPCTAQCASQAQLPLNCATKEELEQLEAFLLELNDRLEHLSKAFYDVMAKMNQKVEPPPPSPTRPIIIQQAPARCLAESTGPGSAPCSSPRTSPTRGSARSPTQGLGSSESTALSKKIGESNDRLNQLENKLTQINKLVYTPKGNIQQQIRGLQDQIDYYSKDKTTTDGSRPPPVVVTASSAPASVSTLSPHAPRAPFSPLPPTFATPGGQPNMNDAVRDIQGLMSLFNTVENMQSQLQQVHDTALQLAAESEDRQVNIDALLEQIELLKAIKLDREDMVEALADKADMRMLTRKVSHDQFEMAYDDLSKGLEQALGKLNVQEVLWQQALDEIQREIETKLDKMELSPVKEFFNNKLKLLQENLKKLAQLRREAEAAGTKKKLLTDVNCISCDAKAYMQMDPTGPVPPRPLPPTKSMKPYLCYELDAIRKSQSSALPQRNMHDWEKIDKQMTSKQPHKVRSDTGKHLCNRYCGGSHTMTTPAQRVARVGHFIKQWGPEVLPLSSGFAIGDDGRQYKVSGTEGANVGPGGAVDAQYASKSAKKPEQKFGMAFSARKTELLTTEQPEGRGMKSTFYHNNYHAKGATGRFILRDSVDHLRFSYSDNDAEVKNTNIHPETPKCTYIDILPPPKK